ncbi:MAG: hypothetical protein WAU78_11890 [Roseiarcus sp.]
MAQELAIITALALLALGTSAGAADVCEAVALRNVPALEDPSAVIRRGDHDTGIAQYRVSKKTGEDELCSHGGYCYPVHATESGQRIEVLRLTNCSIGARDPYDDPDDIFYRLDVIRSAVPPQTLKINDVDDSLLKLGLCSACANNAAFLYVTTPESRCARVVKEALEGNPDAVKALNSGDNDLCDASQAPASVVSGPSFDCRKASLPAEQTICHSARLAAMDLVQAKLYAGLRSVATPRERKRIDADQLAWIRSVQSCGWNADCISSAYQAHVTDLHRSGPAICDGPILQQPAECDAGGALEDEMPR